eukprot:CAMPEP_0183786260 /NCGR_PEP_ID=MMETSP0739-20130205/66926_1 /TAXON_ID=385413 /ORGANISM="Thalassiosira miniscula, Strain CCMP1093" /LENGTH=869 /DNA_ID=CAMNT_0026030301 /DNA_START=145 /DNA_END=2754 /DNA_ORIENTATION=+
MKLATFLLTATLQKAAEARLLNPERRTEDAGIDPHSYCVGGINGPSERAHLDLSNAYDPLHIPEQIYPDKDGVTRARLLFDLADYDGPSYSTILRTFNGGQPGPTIHVTPGGRLDLQLVNCLVPPDGAVIHNAYQKPNSTNIHTHGPHITGNTPGDNVFAKVSPGEYFNYSYEFGNNHMPGTFWYHPHLHGSTALQVGQGAAGMIVMDEPRWYSIPKQIKNMEEIQMVFQHMDLGILRDSSRVSEDDVTDWNTKNFKITNATTDLTNFMLVNMQFLPKVTMIAGKWYRWRTVLSSIRSSVAFVPPKNCEFKLLAVTMIVGKWYRWRTVLSSIRSSVAFVPPKNCEFKLLAKDGMFLNDAPRSVEAVILSPGNRADVAVRCMEPGQEYVNTTYIDLLCGTNLGDFTVPNSNFGCFDPNKQPVQKEAASAGITEDDFTVPNSNFGCFDPDKQPPQQEEAGIAEITDYPPVEKMAGTFLNPIDQPTIMVIDVVLPPPDKDLDPFDAPTPCYLVDLADVGPEEIETSFVNRYHCHNPPGTPGPGWPAVITDRDECGDFTVPNSNFGCFDPNKQPVQKEAASAGITEDPPVDEMAGTFLNPIDQPTIMVIDVVLPPPDKDLRRLNVPRPCYLVDLVDLGPEEIETSFVNRYHCHNPPGTPGPGWPAVITDRDECGVYGPYGVGYEGSEEDLLCEEAYPGEGDCPFTPWVDMDTYINDFATGTVNEVELLGVPFHPYHQHINSFQITEINTRNLDVVIQDIVANWYKVGDWQDTLQFPAALSQTGIPPGYFNPGVTPPPQGFFAVKIRFQADQFTGHMVQHCHLLFHEDQGMMAQYNVTGEEGFSWKGARMVDSRCVKTGRRHPPKRVRRNSLSD